MEEGLLLQSYQSGYLTKLTFDTLQSFFYTGEPIYFMAINLFKIMKLSVFCEGGAVTPILSIWVSHYVNSIWWIMELCMMRARVGFQVARYTIAPWYGISENHERLDERPWSETGNLIS